MQTTQLYGQYRQTQAITASRTQLVVLLYEGLVRFCTTAEMATRTGDIQGRHTSLLKAQAIIAELSGSLNHEQGGEIATDLSRLYDYCYRRLVEANLTRDPEIIVEVRGLLNELLAAWRAVAQQEHTLVATPLAGSLVV